MNPAKPSKSNISGKSRNFKRQVTIQAILLLGIVLIINVIFSLIHKRIDLTEDRRFTVSPQTVKLLKGLKDVVFVKVYLTGDDLPAGIRRLSDASREMLDEFRNIAGDRIQYEYINPDDLPDKATRNNLYQQLANQGLEPTELQVNEEEKFSQKIIVPGAIVSYQGTQTPAILMQPQRGDASPEEELNSSMAQLEYQLAFAIRKIASPEKKKIAIIQGHAELKPVYLTDIGNSLAEYYQVDFVNLPVYKVGRLDEYAAIIIAKPDSVFTELEKFKLDQYLVKGGKILLAADNLTAELDSLRGGSAFSSNKELNLEDQLFKYGIRLNYDLVQDLNCNTIPLLKNGFGAQQRGNLVKWPYYPVVTPASDHPIVNSINAIWFRFASTIDTIHSKQNPDIRKTVLLTTSPYSRVQQHPVQININMVSTLDQRMYHTGIQTLAVLMEGRFRSAFVNRISPQELEQQGYGSFKEQDKPGKLIVISDGDVLKNNYNAAYQRIYPLGYDAYSKHTFGNKTFILNCIDYMVDDAGLIALRSKQFKLRMLNSAAAKESRTGYQILNTLVPVLLILIFGIVFNYIRKRRFA